MKSLSVLTFCISSLLFLSNTAYPQQGRISGEQVYDIPDWFKLSFLDIREDNNEAKDEEKGLILFMHLDGCPYCARMLNENFRQGETRDYIQKHFDVIAINILGGREVSWADGKSYSEKALAAKLKVHFTPTIVLLDEKANKVLQINGYRKPRAFRHALEYVQGKSYRRLTLAQYIEQQSQQAVYDFIDEPDFTRVNYFSDYQKPLAILFEDRDCDDCTDFHRHVLQNPQVREELAPYLVVRLDAYSDHTLVDIDGNMTSPREWARKLGLSYRPGMILFNEGKEQSRIDGRLYHFHFKEALRYVSHRLYKQYASYNSYLAARQQELLNQGININLAE